MDRAKIDNALQNERKKYLGYEDTTNVSELESLYLRIAKEIPEDLDSQPLVIAMEECGELSQAIAKGIRGKADPIHLAEEIADVSIIIDYVKKTWDINDDDIKIIRALKLEQLEGIVTRLQTEYKSKLSALSMMDTFTTLREMTYDGFIDIYMKQRASVPPAIVPLDSKCGIAAAFVDAHWRATPQINENGIRVLQGALKTIKIRSRSLTTYVGSTDYEPTPVGDQLSDYHKVLYTSYQIEALIWILAMTFRRFSVLNAWVGDETEYTGRPETLYEFAGIVSSSVHTMGVRIREFIDYAEYNAVTVSGASGIRRVLNDALSAITWFKNNAFSDIDRLYGEAATWTQLTELTKAMKGDDSNAGGSV